MAPLEPVCGLRGIGGSGPVTQRRVMAIPDHRVTSRVDVASDR